MGNDMTVEEKYEARIEELEDQVKSKDSKIEYLELSLEEKEKECEDVKDELDSANDDISSLQSQIEEQVSIHPRLGIHRTGDSIYLKGRFLCDLGAHGPDGDEFGHILTELFPRGEVPVVR